MSERPEDICPRPVPPAAKANPLAPPLYLSSVYRCEDTSQASAVLSGEAAGYAYVRDGHPNAAMLAERCRELNAADEAAITSSGMSALALAILSQLKAGDHVLGSNQLYGQSLNLLSTEAGRLGIASTLVDTCDLTATRAAFTSSTRLVVVETITNPLLRVSDIRALAEMAHERGARLLVDNTLAGPVVCRPLELGADLVLESITKTMNGHSDVLLGLLCGRAAAWDRVAKTRSTWGLTGSAMDCWLALRGLGTLALRIDRAAASAQRVAEFLSARREVEIVHYPGLPSHPDHAVAKRQLAGRFGTLVTFTLRGDLATAEAFIRAAANIPFCPSLGELSTTLTHPASTSHRAMADEERRRIGIHDGTIRLSIGLESAESIEDSLERALAGAK